MRGRFVPRFAIIIRIQETGEGDHVDIVRSAGVGAAAVEGERHEQTPAVQPLDTAVVQHIVGGAFGGGTGNVAGEAFALIGGAGEDDIVPAARALPEEAKEAFEQSAETVEQAA